MGKRKVRQRESKRVLRALRKAGCEVVGSAGGHTVILCPNGTKIQLALRHHSVHGGSLIYACKKAGLDWDVIEEAYY